MVCEYVNKHRTEILYLVLILVLMEDGLRVVCCTVRNIFEGSVLILVLMEDGLRELHM